jgi:hypothetical protein
MEKQEIAENDGEEGSRGKKENEIAENNFDLEKLNQIDS